MSDIQQLVDEIRDLELAIAECDHGMKQTRLKLVLVSRRQQLADLRNKANARAR